MAQPTANEMALARAVYELQKQVAVLSGARQLPSSTIETDAGAVGVLDAAVAGTEAAAAVPGLQLGVDYGASSVDGLRLELDNSDDALDDVLEAGADDLDDARADLEDAQADIEDAFGQTVEGLSADVDTAIRAAGSAQTEAEAASDAARDAAGLAASKGRTIVQVSAPTGVNADPANLWINISTDSNGVPKNQPNRYNPDTSMWEPITDAQAVAAAQDAATAVAAAQAAKDVADQANAAAGVAKTAADNANTAALQAAGIANGKGKVIYQASKPTGTNAAAGNLWIRTSDNTPWAYDASIPDWVQVTDQTAKDAAAAAVQAQQAATAAANAASAAQATADSKPLILFSSTAGPSGTAPTGSTWFLWDSAKNIAGQWLQSGTLANPVWTPQQITSQVIANVDLGKLTAGSAAIADLVAQKIAASTANFQTVNVSNLFVTSGATMSQAVIDFLFANVVQAKKITAGMIDVDSLNGVTITGAKLKSAASGARVEISGTAMSVFSATSTSPVGYFVANDGSDTSGTYSYLAMINNYSAALGGSALYLTPPRNPDASSYESTRTVNLRLTHGLTAPVVQANTIVAGGRAFYKYPLVDSPSNSPVAVTSDSYRVGMSAGTPVIFTDGNVTGAPVVVQASDFRLPSGTSISADTDWIPLTAAPGYTASSDLAIRVQGGWAIMRGQVTKNSGNWGASETSIVRVPAGCRANGTKGFVGIGAGSATTKLITRSDGYFDTAGTPANGTTTYVRFDNVVYLAEN